MRSILTYLFVHLCLSGSVIGAGQLLALVPVKPGTGDGNAAFSVPFNDATDTIRFQQVYSASAFSQVFQSSPGGFFINTIGFRGDEQFGGGNDRAPNFQINLSTTQKGPDGLSAVFSQNVGLDDTVVFGPGGRNFLSSPRQYDAITLSTPFFYNPSAGNLLLDVRMYSPIVYPPGGQAYLIDAESTVGDSISSVFALNVNAVTGTALTAGLMTEFIG